MKQYPEYKESGLNWLNKIPKHWDIKRNKYILFEVNERSETGNEDLLTVSQYTGVTKRKDKIVDEKSLLTNAESLVGYKLAKPKDIVMNIMLAWNGSLGVSNYYGIVSPAYCVYRPKAHHIESKYFHYLFRTSIFTGIFKTYSTGIIESRLRLYPDVFFRINSIIPQKKEQRQIVKFLDIKCAQIAKFIRNKRRLIQLLKEQMQVIINQAVTCGVDEKGNLRQRPESLPAKGWKVSGVDWLGYVSEHWKVMRLRYLGKKFGSGLTPRGGATVYQEHGVPFLRSQNVHFEGLKLDDVVYISEEIHKSMPSTHVYSGDVLLNITGASIGRACFVTKSFGEGNVNQHVCIIRPKVNLIYSEYLSAYLSTSYIQNKIIVDQNGASREGLPLKAIKDIVIIFPSLEEQNQILEYIKNSTEKISVAILKANREIELIQEYRTRLISDVVTGKVDVRNIKVEDVAEEELLDDMSDTEEISACADLSAVSTAQAGASADREELEDSIEDGKEV